MHVIIAKSKLNRIDLPRIDKIIINLSIIK